MNDQQQSINNENTQIRLTKRNRLKGNEPNQG